MSRSFTSNNETKQTKPTTLNCDFNGLGNFAEFAANIDTEHKVNKDGVRVPSKQKLVLSVVYTPSFEAKVQSYISRSVNNCRACKERAYLLRLVHPVTLKPYIQLKKNDERKYSINDEYYNLFKDFNFARDVTSISAIRPTHDLPVLNPSHYYHHFVAHPNLVFSSPFGNLDPHRVISATFSNLKDRYNDLLERKDFFKKINQAHGALDTISNGGNFKKACGWLREFYELVHSGKNMYSVIIEALNNAYITSDYTMPYFGQATTLIKAIDSGNFVKMMQEVLDVTTYQIKTAEASDDQKDKALSVIGSYKTHFPTINELLKTGQFIKTPMDGHVTMDLTVKDEEKVTLEELKKLLETGLYTPYVKVASYYMGQLTMPEEKVFDKIDTKVFFTFHNGGTNPSLFGLREGEWIPSLGLVERDPGCFGFVVNASFHMNANDNLGNGFFGSHLKSQYRIHERAVDNARKFENLVQPNLGDDILAVIASSFDGFGYTYLNNSFTVALCDNATGDITFHKITSRTSVNTTRA